MSQLTCDEAMRQFFAYLDRALSSDAVEEIEAHLEECLSCCDRLAFSRHLDGFVKTRLADPEMPAALEGRIRERLGTMVMPAPHPASPPEADRVLDGGSRACGELLIEIKNTLDGMSAGQVLKLVSHDPGAKADLPVWCQMTRHALLWSDDGSYYIRRRES